MESGQLLLALDVIANTLLVWRWAHLVTQGHGPFEAVRQTTQEVGALVSTPFRRS